MECGVLAMSGVNQHEKIKSPSKRVHAVPAALEPIAPPPGPLDSREDVRRLVLKLWRPMLALGSASNARCCPGETGAVYDDGAAGLEGFCRPLWAVLACAAHGDSLPGTELLAEAVRAGVDHSHPDYWGEFVNDDQRCVEMAVLGWALLQAPNAFWTSLDDPSRDRFVEWISQINRVTRLPANNWRFFRILVNLGLRAVRRPHSPERLEEDLALIESCYLGDGWYSDGRGTQRDYYVAMAMHFNGLLIAAARPPGFDDYTARYRERARLFAPHFLQWFVPDGAALPYGRSLIYRFAQAAFWSALAWAGEEALPWGVIKGVLLRHVRSWLGRPIFDHAGVLSIGYGYGNLNMAESYNSPSSPYWATKALLVAGLPKEHPFWQAAEASLPRQEEKSVQVHPGFIIRRHDDQQQITVLASGQFPNGWHLRHAAAKYAKFAYSTRFGFSVPVGSVTLEDGAYDNALALSDDGHHWRVREKCTEVRIEGDMLFSTWSPWEDVKVGTWLLFDANWQVRVHRLETGRPLHSAEAGHAVPRPDAAPLEEENYGQVGHGRAAAIFSDNAAGLVDPLASRAGAIVMPTPNSNLLHPRTVLPTLRASHAPGVHWLVTFLPLTCNPALFLHLLDPDVEARKLADGVMLRLPSGRVMKFLGAPAVGFDTPADRETVTAANNGI